MADSYSSISSGIVDSIICKIDTRTLERRLLIIGLSEIYFKYDNKLRKSKKLYETNNKWQYSKQIMSQSILK